MSLGAILLIILVLVLIGALPTWGHSQAWGYGPSGLVSSGGSSDLGVARQALALSAALRRQ
jgi:hypothetical protein